MHISDNFLSGQIWTPIGERKFQYKNIDKQNLHYVKSSFKEQQLLPQGKISRCKHPYKFCVFSYFLANIKYPRVQSLKSDPACV